jgi:hypothetical protein
MKKAHCDRIKQIHGSPVIIKDAELKQENIFKTENNKK